MSSAPNSNSSVTPPPLPDGRDVLLTDDREKLPTKWAELMDASRPLPPGVAFFEKRVVVGDLITAVLLAAVLSLLGVICLPFGFWMLWSGRGDRNSGNSGEWWMIGFGVVMLFAAWMMAVSVPARWRIMQRQSRGELTRLGVFIAGDELCDANEHHYTLIPREKFSGLSGRDMKYVFKDQTKSFRLPANLVRDDPRAMTAAIEQWAGLTSSSRSPR